MICYGLSDDLYISELFFSLLETCLEYIQKISSILTKQLLDHLQFTFCTPLKCLLRSESLSSLGFNNLNVSFTVLPYLLGLNLMGVDSFSNGSWILGFRHILFSSFDFFSVLNFVLSWIPMMCCWFCCRCC